MQNGEVPADWRSQRIAVQAAFVPTELLPEIRFLDVEALKTRRVLERSSPPYWRSMDIQSSMCRLSGARTDVSPDG